MESTSERVQLGGRSAVVYKGPRGGKYVKKGGQFISLNAAKRVGGKAPRKMRGGGTQLKMN